jgi:hypothetical protein
MTWPERFATNIRYDFCRHGFHDANMVLDPAYGAVVARLDEDDLWRCTFSEDDSLPLESVEDRIGAFLDAFLPDRSGYELVHYGPYRWVGTGPEPLPDGGTGVRGAMYVHWEAAPVVRHRCRWYSSTGAAGRASTTSEHPTGTRAGCRCSWSRAMWCTSWTARDTGALPTTPPTWERWRPGTHSGWADGPSPTPFCGMSSRAAARWRPTR